MSSLTRIQMVIHLQAVDLFAYCAAEQVVRLASIARERPFREGEVLYAASDPPEHLFCLVEGEVELRPPSERSVVAAPGSEPRSVNPPGSFGVREILGDEPRRLEARALRDGLALTLEADDLFDLLSNNIEIVKALFRQLLRAQPAERTLAMAGEGVAG
ncbi:MAG: cyclic nucleotide-binding domain-containing protein [Holophagales bacterium]|nr:cyclic nucleotide-binding domain-containing protein [Holophagales bacterium]